MVYVNILFKKIAGFRPNSKFAAIFWTLLHVKVMNWQINTKNDLSSLFSIGCNPKIRLPKVKFVPSINFFESNEHT